MQTKAKGTLAEAQAASYLQAHGFTIITQNYYAKKMGEVDIVATKEGVYHFVEVKSGLGFDPRQNLSHKKLSRVIKSAYLYLKQHAIDAPFCIDACIVQEGEVELYENITL